MENSTKLTFFGSSRTVLAGGQPAHLSPLEFAVLQDVYQNDLVEFEDLQDRIWKREGVSEGAIRAVCAKVNRKLILADIHLELRTRNSHVAIGSIV
jgi:hypothetical protein